MLTASEKYAHNQSVISAADAEKKMLRDFLAAMDNPGEAAREAVQSHIDWIDTRLESELVQIETKEWGQNIAFRAPNPVKQVAYGFTRLSGIPTFITADQGDEGEYLHILITYAGHEIDRVTDLYLDGRKVDFSADQIGGGDTRRVFGPAINDWANLVFFSPNFMNGATDQLTDGHLSQQSSVLFPGKWTDDHRQLGCAAFYLRLLYHGEVFKAGYPEITIEGQWRNDIYDPRDSSTGHSNNAALVRANYLMDSVYGPGYDASEIDMASLSEAADICDEAVSLAAGGTESRYTANGSFLASKANNHKLIGSHLDNAMGGGAVWTGKDWKFYPGKWRTPVMSINESHLRSKVKLRAKRGEQFNEVRGKYRGEKTLWEWADYPPIKNATYAGQDAAGTPPHELDLPFVTSPSQAQRIAKIELEKNRQGQRFEAEFSAVCYPLEPEDNIYLDNEQFGFSSKTFVVDRRDLLNEFHSKLLLLETASGVFDWNNGEETTVDLSPNTSFEFSQIPAPTGLTLSSGTGVLEKRLDGTIWSRIKVQWDATSDLSVSTGGEFEIQAKKTTDSTWIPMGFVGGDQNCFYITDVIDGESYDVRVRAVTLRKGAWAEELGHVVVGKTENPSEVTDFTVQTTAEGIVLSWTNPGDADYDFTEIRVGSTWSGGTRIYRGDGESHTYEKKAAASYTFHIASRDTSENYSNRKVKSITITAPSKVRALSELTIYSMVTLKWQEPTSYSYRLNHYKIYRGSTFGGATYVGRSDGTFKTFQVDTAGDYTYWVTAVDSAGNEGAETSIPVTVEQLPFFELLADVLLDPDDATLTNALSENEDVVAPVDTSETFADHFDNNSWTDPQDQIDAGYPLYIQPSNTSNGTVVWVYDYGVGLAAGALVNFAHVVNWVDGDGTVKIDIGHSADNVSYTTTTDTSSIYAPSGTRYIKVTLTVDGDDDTSVARINENRLKLAVVKKEVTVTVSAAAADSGGTTVTNPTGVLDVIEDSVRPRYVGSNAYFASHTISGNTIKVFLWDTSGTRQDGTIEVDYTVIKSA